MQILSNGFKKPNTGDRGSIFFPALEFDIQQLNDHTHNGVNSEKVQGLNVTKGTDTLLPASWVLESGSRYSQTITMPVGYTYDETLILCFVSGDRIYPTLTKMGASSYKIYTNDNTITVNVRYL